MPRWATGTVLLLVCAPLLAQPPVAKRPLDPWLLWPLPDPKDPETWNRKAETTGGFVQSIDARGITLHWPERKVFRFRHNPKTGELLSVEEETAPVVPARKFPFVDELAKGGYLKTAGFGMTYRVADVQVGDRVDIEVERREGVDVCRTIQIRRRPGGTVPPAPGEKPTEIQPYHERANADQQWEEKRVPYPRKYWPAYLGPDGLFYTAPYPSDSRQIVLILPLAPAPREVKPSAPPLKP